LREKLVKKLKEDNSDGSEPQVPAEDRDIDTPSEEKSVDKTAKDVDASKQTKHVK
jgi:hypothetical protein